MLTKLFGSGLLGKKKFTKEEMEIKIASHIKRLWDMQKKRIKWLQICQKGRNLISRILVV